MEIDKLLAAVGAIGEILGVYFKSLLKNGFTREEALVLCVEFADCLYGISYYGEEAE